MSGRHETGEPDEMIGTSVLFANDRIRVWELKLDPGESSGFHRHFSDYVFIYAAPSTLEVSVGNKPPTVAASKEGFVMYWEVGKEGIPPHQIRNIGPKAHHEIIVEFLGPSRALIGREPETNGLVEGEG